MSEAIRNLQIFRNGTLMVDSMANVKAAVETAFITGDLVLKDGEPISIRYKESDKEPIRGLFGVAYVNKTNEGTVKKEILWSPNPSDLVIDTKGDDYITLNYSIYDKDAVTFTAGANVTTIEDAGKYLDAKTGDVITKEEYDGLTDDKKLAYTELNGLATAKDVKSYVNSIEIPEGTTYTIVKREVAENGYFATYELKDGDDNTVGDAINIPKDFLVKSGEVKTVDSEGEPYTGAKVGDKYIDFVINAKEGTSTEEHIYLPVNDLVDAYTTGNGIDISEANEISIKVKDGEDYIEVTEDGIATTEALTTKITDEAEKAAKAAVQGLGTKTASDGKYISGIKVNEDGEFEIDETVLPEGDIYYGGKDVVVIKDTRDGDNEAKNYIDTALDQDITAGVKVGFLDQNQTLTAGSSLSEILTKILVKRVGITSANPTNSLTVSGNVNREVGTALGTVTLTPTYVDGYYKASDTTIYTNDLFKQKNPTATSDGKLYADCESGDVTFYKGTTAITDVDETTEGFQYKDDNVVTSKSSYNFYAETAYGASKVNSCNDNLGTAQEISIQAGKTAKSTAATVNFCYKTRVSNLSGVVWDVAEGYLVDGSENEYVPGVSLKNDMSTNGSFLTSTTQDNTKTYTLYGNSSLYVIVPKNVTFVIYATTDATKTNNLFNQFKKYSTTNDNNVEYDIYIYPNNGSGDLQLTGLKYSSLQ